MNSIATQVPLVGPCISPGMKFIHSQEDEGGTAEKDLLIAEVAERIGWTRLWDVGLDFGEKAVRRATESEWSNEPTMREEGTHVSYVTLPHWSPQSWTTQSWIFTLDFKATGTTASGDHRYYERGVALLSSGL